MTGRMFEVGRGPGGEIILRFRPRRVHLLPGESGEHLRAAGREVLLAMRAVLDAALNVLEERKEEAPPRRRRIQVKEEKPSP